MEEYKVGFVIRYINLKQICVSICDSLKTDYHNKSWKKIGL